MGDADITTSAWRLVEVGRVVLFNEGVYEGRLATIVEIIDHKRVRKSGGIDAVHQLTHTGPC
jgi:large subunit ribosomal protein L14e